MATMIKEKRREKKKPKNKVVTKHKDNLELNTPTDSVDETSASKENTPEDVSLSSCAHASTSAKISKTTSLDEDLKKVEESITQENVSEISRNIITEQAITTGENTIYDDLKIGTKVNNETPKSVAIGKELSLNTQQSITQEQKRAEIIQSQYLESYNAQNSYEALNSKLKIFTMGASQTDQIDLRHTEIESHIDDKMNVLARKAQENFKCKDSQDINERSVNAAVVDKLNTLTLEHHEKLKDNLIPSAPMLEEVNEEQTQYRESAPCYVAPKIESMPLDEAYKLCGGKEIAEIRAMSDREEMIVEAGPVSGPEHPLVDLLSTFRSSLMAVDRERNQLTVGFIEEEKFRSTLWKVEKRDVVMRKKCPCGLNVDLRGSYEHAELLKERLPVAKLRLESLLRDVQESYCHHQHAALLAHCQIEDLIHQTMQSNKPAIREALALILEALRLSDGGTAGGASVLLSSALQRWARALSAALLDGRDVRQLLHLLHHLFRQTRSVYWAASVIHLNVRDRVEAAQAIAILDLMLNRSKVEPALECTEEDAGTVEPWEEVTAGGGGAVMAGRARERDLCALLTSLPLKQLVATITLFTHANISRARETDWGDSSGGVHVTWSCAAARALLHVLQRAVNAHVGYTRLADVVNSLASSLLHALAALHMHSRPSYAAELEVKLAAELEAVFAAGFTLFGRERLETLPTTLLSGDTAMEYCLANITGLHDKCTKTLATLSVELPVLPCADRVRIVSQAARDRWYDHHLAATVLDFLFQTGIKRKSVTCKGCCEKTARELLPGLLATHPYLYPLALHKIADLSQVETIDPSCITCISARDWRPQPTEAVAVLSDWSKRCPNLVRHLLTALDYTPHTGLSLDTQLSIGSWLCEHVSEQPTIPEWAWGVLRLLRTHRAWWGQFPFGDAPPPSEDPQDLFSMAYALLATSMGHSIPIICSEGVWALCKMAASRCGDAAHCLAPLMLVMAHSPESLALTPKFEELFQTLLSHGPSLVQRALGLGPAPGSELLLRIMLAQLENSPSSSSPSANSVLSAWLHALWRPALLAMGSATLLDSALLATRNWAQFDSYVTTLLMNDNYKEHVNAAAKCVTQAPLIAECALRNAHGQRESLVWTWVRLLDAVYAQKITGEKIHVDNVLKLMGCKMTSDDLVIFKTASAILSAPLHHPAHLTLWCLLMYLYLQRPPSASPNAMAVGPLLFSGIIKSRTLAQLRKKLQETATYHQNERNLLLPKPKEETNERTRNSSKSAPVDDSLLSEISIVDLTGGSSDTESSDAESVNSKSSDSDSNRDSTATETRDTTSRLDSETEHLIVYHTNAEKMLREFHTWLEQGEKVPALAHHANFSRFIPETALDAAWRRELNRRRPAPDPETIDPPSPAPRGVASSLVPKTPFQMAVSAIKRIKVRSRRRLRKPSIRSPIEDVNFRDARTLLKLVDKHLSEIESLAREWLGEVERVCCLDSRLWSLVCQLRVRRPVPPLKKACANKCKPITFVMPEEEWCISTGAENGIKENRESARVCIRRVSRPRPHAARTVAALYSIARGIRSPDVASATCSRVWRSAEQRGVDTCAPAHRALTTLCTDLAEKWLCSDGKACATLLSTWAGASSSSLQQTLCGSLVSPRRLSPQHWPQVYMVLLQSKLPSHAIFSYLSRFEMSRWREHADGSQRRDLLEALVKAAQRWGPKPHQDHHVLLELLGVHTSALMDAQEICGQARCCALASVAGHLPPQYWGSLAAAVRRCGARVPFDQLGHTLRELGMAFWEARANATSNKKRPIGYAMYAVNVAEALHDLQRAFVAAGIALTYAPEKVGRYSWSSLQESWSPWISCHALPPLLPSTTDDEQYTTMLQRFVQCINQIIADSPGSEEVLLQQCFSWMCQSYTNVYSSPPSQESRVQASATLAAIAELPWQHYQWLSEESVLIACQIATSADSELKRWCADRWRHQTAEAWMRGVPPERYAERLAALLALFTAMNHAQETLEEASRLPWTRLPAEALDAALERFFQLYHNPGQPYHEMPQFRVLLFGAELCIPPGAQAQDICRASSKEKRLRFISHWTRAACAPTLDKHVVSYSEAVLNTIVDIAAYLELSAGELEELLSRAVVIMCIESAAAHALPVWQQRIRRCSVRVCEACVSAAASVTAFNYYAPLMESAVAAYMACTEFSSWSALHARILSGPWRDIAPLCVGGHIHAAYATAHALRYDVQRLNAAFNALLAANVHFAEQEVIAALWVCLICRVARQCADWESQPQNTQNHRWSSEDLRQCLCAGKEVLLRWCSVPRRSLISVVTMQQHHRDPTNKIRLLASLSLCALPGADEATSRAYQTCCAQVLSTSAHEINWSANATVRRVPQLAVRLFPAADKYFKEELDAASAMAVV